MKRSGLIIRRALACLVLLAPVGPSLAGKAVRTEHARAELVAEVSAIGPSTSFWVALRLRARSGWHTYWRNPGDSGLPTRVEWRLPPGFAVSEPHWPYPEYIATPPFASHGYHGELLLLFQVSSAEQLADGAATLAARADWLVCREICLPEHAELALTLPVADAPVADRFWTKGFAQVRARWPRQLPDLPMSAARHGEEVYLWVAPPAGDVASARIHFFANEPSVIEPAAPQTAGLDGDRLRITLRRSTLAAAPLERLSGVLVAPAGWVAGDEVQAVAGDEVQAVAVDLPVTVLNSVPGGGSPPGLHSSEPEPVVRLRLPLALLLAFAGGLILNLMPCVFPVLSIKVLSFVGMAHGEPKRVRLHGLAFAGGVLVSFWLLLGGLLALRAAGTQVGWGFQLQSAGFVTAMIGLLFVVGLNLLGVFDFGRGLVGLAGDLEPSEGYQGSFATGVLASVLATPCTAPFMSLAIGYALTQAGAVAFLVFSALAIGMAAPYLMLAEVPGLLGRLPKSGPWLETFRQLLAFPVLATAIWLLWVLDQQVGANGAALVLLGLLCLGFAAWLFGRRQRALSRSTVGAFVATGAVLLAIVMAVAGSAPRLGKESQDDRQQAAGLDWQPYSDARLAEFRAAGRNLFVDFTAAWCITCKVNKAVALHADAVVERMRALDVKTLQADWTNYDAEISRALNRFGRSGVPLYVYYPAGRDPVVLPEFLTPGIVLDVLKD